MTDESSGILLNLTSVPVKKKKKKSDTGNIGNHQFRGNIAGTIEPKIKTPIATLPKPKRIITNQSKSVKVIKSKPKTTVNASSNSPSGILKKTLTVPSHSIWKKFKKSNKGDDGCSFNSTKPKGDLLNESNKKINNQVNINVPKFKKVSFGESCLNKEEKSDGLSITKGNSKSLKDSFQQITEQVANDDYSFKVDLNNDKKKRNKKKFVGDDNLLNASDSKRESKSGKVTSLFHNNPVIPEIAHRAVKPVKEDVFSNVSFETLNLHPFMVKYLKESMGLTTPTMVQAKAIPIILDKKDALVRSQTGSGKTLAFALPILHRLQEIRPKISRADGVLALVVIPTRELALQTYEVFNKLVKSYTWIVPGYLVGGEKRKSEKARLRKGITILIGTPGRLIDHIQHTKALTLDKVEWLVIDEADRMLDMGYEKDVSTLLEKLNSNASNSSLLHPNYLSSEEPAEEKSQMRQTILLSATLSQKVQKLAGLSLRDPVYVDACEKDLTSEGHVPVFTTDVGAETDTMVLPESLAQKYVVIPPKLKLVTLAAFILKSSEVCEHKKMLVFVATQDMVDYYTELLSSVFGSSDGEEKEVVNDSEDLPSFPGSGVDLFKLHGNMKQSERTEVFKTFRKSSVGVLLCTDVAARGLDLPEVDWVIQFTGPISVSDYVHRVGRTARGGQSGSSIIFLTPNEVGFIGKLENCQIRLQEEKMENCLGYLVTRSAVNRRAKRTIEEEATKLQMKFEKLIADNGKLYDLACKAYASWSRFYASYPKNMRDTFSVKTVHQGHYAKSFALRDTPSAIVSYARKKSLNEKRHLENILAAGGVNPTVAYASDSLPALPPPSHKARLPNKRPRDRKEDYKKDKFEGKNRLAKISEFDSGLEPLPKKKKVL